MRRLSDIIYSPAPNLQTPDLNPNLVLTLNLSGNPFKLGRPAQMSPHCYWNVYLGSYNSNNSRETPTWRCLKVCIFVICKFWGWKIKPLQTRWTNTAGPDPQPSGLYFHLWPVSDLILFLQLQSDKQQATKQTNRGLLCLSAASTCHQSQICITAAQHHKTGRTARLLFVG